MQSLNLSTIATKGKLKKIISTKVSDIRMSQGSWCVKSWKSGANHPILPPLFINAFKSRGKFFTLCYKIFVFWHLYLWETSANINNLFWTLINLPITLIMRPRVSSPTGIRMGDPVSTTFCPRIRPSVPSIAMVLTVFSPKCWATSRTSLGERPPTSKALRISGRPSSNCTSTTAPITATIWPSLAFAAATSSA